jgi:regulator of replication initiation timing
LDFNLFFIQSSISSMSSLPLKRKATDDDVIESMETKIARLTEEVEQVNAKNAQVSTENIGLKLDNQRLHYAIASLLHENKVPDGILECHSGLPTDVLEHIGSVDSFPI